jgi:LmbE family N-acetylglucosaminyl deacetylase
MTSHGGSLKKNNLTQVILVVVAHPDDEVLGCGGTIANYSREGHDVHVAFLADGVSARNGKLPPDLKELKERQEAAKKSAAVLGIKSLHFGEFPDNQMDTIPLLQVTKEVEGLIRKVQPETVITHFGGDLNIDHRKTFEAVLTACRPQAGHPVKTILCFETPSSTEWQSGINDLPFCPNWFVDISKTLSSKLKALDAYTSEMRPWPHPRSNRALEHIAGWRGATIGKEAAEAFMLVRRLE